MDRRSCIPWRRPRAVAFFLLPAALVALGYGHTANDFFLCDDFLMLHNAAGAEGWGEAATLGESWSLRWLRPVPLWSWWLQYDLAGNEPLGYRLTNLALHAVNAGLLAWLVAILARSTVAGAVAGAAFAAFPNHPEAVTWVSGRFDVLSCTGVVVCLLAWTRWLCEGGRRRHLALGALGMLFACASKEAGFALAFLVPGLTLGFFRPAPRRVRVGYASLLAVMVLWLLVRAVYIGGPGGMIDHQGENLTARIDPFHAARFLGAAALQGLLPTHHFNSTAWEPPRFLPVVGGIVALVVCARIGRLRSALRSVAPFLALFLLALTPVMNWATLGMNNESTRYLYIPTLFSCGAFGCVFAGFEARRGSAAIGAACLLATVGVWQWSLVLENSKWHEAANLAEKVVESFPPPVDPGELAEHEIRVFVTQLPDNYYGAYVFRNSFRLAAELFTAYGTDVRELRAVEDWEAARARRRRGRFLYWDDADQSWREPAVDGSSVPRPATVVPELSR